MNNNLLMKAFFHLSVAVSVFSIMVVFGLFFNGEQLLVDYSGKVIRVFGGVVVEGLFVFALVGWLISTPMVVVSFIKSKKSSSKILKVEYMNIFLSIILFTFCIACKLVLVL
ncbi:hypothetical protein [Pleionea sp. CnH1-48]|uniref:hypothetical protein n=1 Tax=Pleionea sp. CnH1-48 TaxID=2954494 RepID=UPI002096C231|nr:hypothetical protein [Pleionea sp. CnH1-48]MCO7222967.1 hypothetical protein [Pleionea sp. CnH1-48]